MKGLSAEGQNALSVLKEHHQMSETQIVEAVLRKADQATVSAAVEAYRAELPERPYTRALLGPSNPRRSKYNFGQLIGSREGRVFSTAEYAKAVEWILTNAYGFARRWHIVLKYEHVNADSVHLWFFRANDPLAQAKDGRDLRRLIRRLEQEQGSAASGRTGTDG